MELDRRMLLVGGAATAAAWSSAGLAAGETADAPGQEGYELPAAQFVYEAIVTLGPVEEAGVGPTGRRVRIPITGGTFEGPDIRGSILASGEDWQLIRSDGYVQIEANYWMRADDGTLVHIVNKGVVGEGYGRTTPWFEVPVGPHDWLNKAVFVGTLGPVPEIDAPAVRIRVFKVI